MLIKPEKSSCTTETQRTQRKNMGCHALLTHLEGESLGNAKLLIFCFSLCLCVSVVSFLG